MYQRHTEKEKKTLMTPNPHSATVFMVTCLFSTFPDPPFTPAASPFNTARKFWGVTSYITNTQIILVNGWQTHRLPIQISELELHALTHITNVILQHSFVNIRSIGSVYDHSWSRVTGHRKTVTWTSALKRLLVFKKQKLTLKK